MKTDKQANEWKSKSLVTLDTESYFNIFVKKIENYFWVSKLVFWRKNSVTEHFARHFRMKWWVIELHNYIMNDNSEAHNLGQILWLLHLTPVIFRPGLPYSQT